MLICPTQVWRLDIFFLTIGFLGYAFKYLDQTNIVCLFAAPGNILFWRPIRATPMFPEWKPIWNFMEMSWITLPLSSSKSSVLLLWSTLIDNNSIGYMIMLYPSCIIISHIGPSIWLPTCEVSKNQFLLFRNVDEVFRSFGVYWLVVYPRSPTQNRYRQPIHSFHLDLTVFSLGIWPSLSDRFFWRRNLARLFYHHQVNPPLYPKKHACWLQFSQWYLPHEMALRMSLYNIAQPVGAMLSGAMQGALSTNLEGALGRTGWRWAFIINVSITLAIFNRFVLTPQGVCTIFIALLAFVLLPGFVRTDFLPFPVLDWQDVSSRIAPTLSPNFISDLEISVWKYTPEFIFSKCLLIFHPSCGWRANSKDRPWSAGWNQRQNLPALLQILACLVIFKWAYIWFHLKESRMI